MNARETETMIRNLIDRIWNHGELGAVHELCRENMVLHCPHGNRLSGVAAYQGYVASVLAMYPDLRVTVHEVLVAETRVALRYSWAGTFAGGMTAMGPAPAGRTVAVDGVAFYHLLDGQIVAGWLSEDWLSMYQQLGLVPTVPAERAA